MTMHEGVADTMTTNVNDFDETRAVMRFLGRSEQDLLMSRCAFSKESCALLAANSQQGNFPHSSHSEQAATCP